MTMQVLMFYSELDICQHSSYLFLVLIEEQNGICLERAIKLALRY